MWIIYGIVWSAAGLAMAIIGLSVGPDYGPARKAMGALAGIVGGFLGGLGIELWARSSTFGFTAGFMGSLTGAMVLLIAWGLWTRPPAPRRSA